MKKLLLFAFILIGFTASAQYYPAGYAPKVNAYGNGYNRGRWDSAVHIPNKAALVLNDIDTTPQLFVFMDTLRLYANGTYRNIGTLGSGSSYTADEVSLHLSGTTFSVKNTWTGQTAITTLGNISTGTWQATPIADLYIASAPTWNAKLGQTLNSGYFFIGNGSNIAIGVAPSGDISYTSGGVGSLASIITAGSCTSCNLSLDAKGRVIGFANGAGGGSAPPFADNSAVIKNNADNTKLVIFSAASVPTATTVTVTIPGVNGTLDFTNNTSTLTNKTMSASANTFTNFTDANLSGTAGIRNVNLQFSTISGVALGGILFTHIPGYGLSGSNYTGAASQTWTGDTASTHGLVSKDYFPQHHAGPQDTLHINPFPIGSGYLYLTYSVPTKDTSIIKSVKASTTNTPVQYSDSSWGMESTIPLATESNDGLMPKGYVARADSTVTIVNADPTVDTIGVATTALDSLKLKGLQVTAYRGVTVDNTGSNISKNRYNFKLGGYIDDSVKFNGNGKYIIEDSLFKVLRYGTGKSVTTNVDATGFHIDIKGSINTTLTPTSISPSGSDTAIGLIYSSGLEYVRKVFLPYQIVYDFPGPVTNNNTTSYFTLIGAAGGGVSGAPFRAGKNYRITSYGKYSTASTAGQFRMSMQPFTSGNAFSDTVTTFPNNVTNLRWRSEFTIYTKTGGASGVEFIDGFIEFQTGAETYIKHILNNGGASVSVDFTSGTPTLQFQGSWNTANTNNSLTTNYTLIESID